MENGCLKAMTERHFWKTGAHEKRVKAWHFVLLVLAGIVMVSVLTACSKENGETSIQLPESFDMMTIEYQAVVEDHYDGGEIRTIGSTVASEVRQRLSSITCVATSKPMDFPRLIVTLYAGDEKLIRWVTDEEGILCAPGSYQGNFIIHNDDSIYQYLMSVFTNSAD